MEKRKKLSRILALGGIALLLLLYIVNLILALVGSELAHSLLRASLALTVIIPVLLWFLLVLMRKTSAFDPYGEDTLTDEDKEAIRKKMHEDKNLK